MSANRNNLQDVERRLHESLHSEGRLIPTTIEDVELAESFFDESTIELPASLSNPCDILSRIKSEHLNRPVTASPPVFGRLIALLRKEKGLTIADLAQRARVDEQELRRIEAEIETEPKPRTVTQLAEVFGVLPKSLARVANLTRSVDDQLVEGAVTFAACSEHMDKLSKEQKRALHKFVRLLNSLR